MKHFLIREHRPPKPGGLISRFATLSLLLLLLSACGPLGGSDPAPTPTGLAETPTVEPGTEADRVPCEDGRLLVRDLPAIDEIWPSELAAATELANAWEADAILTELRITCQLFDSGFRVQATFYSDEAQALYATDTNESQPFDVAEDVIIPTVDVSVVSFSDLRAILLDADFEDTAQLQPSTGVDIRINSEVQPFGPDTVPLGATLSHVAIERLGEVNDLFIEPSTGDIYRFAGPGG